jgi:hypothetical protein
MTTKRKERFLFGAFCNGILCCRGSLQEMENKVENEQRHPSVLPAGYWEVKRLTLDQTNHFQSCQR